MTTQKPKKSRSAKAAKAAATVEAHVPGACPTWYKTKIEKAWWNEEEARAAMETIADHIDAASELHYDRIRELELALDFYARADSVEFVTDGGERAKVALRERLVDRWHTALTDA